MRRNANPTLKWTWKSYYVLWFYFHAFDFIARTKNGFTKSRGTFRWNVGSLAPSASQQHSSASRAVTSCCPAPPPIWGTDATFWGQRQNILSNELNTSLCCQSSSQLCCLMSLHCSENDWKENEVVFQFACITVCIPNVRPLCNPSAGVYNVWAD